MDAKQNQDFANFLTKNLGYPVKVKYFQDSRQTFFINSNSIYNALINVCYDQIFVLFLFSLLFEKLSDLIVSFLYLYALFVLVYCYLY